MLRRSRSSLLAGALVLAAVAGCSAGAEDPVAAGSATSTVTTTTTVTPPPVDTRPQLPGGGRSVFPEHVVVAHYGTAGTDALGVLGGGTPLEAAERVVAAAEPYSELTGRPVLPVMELVATVAQQVPGPDGDYSQPLRPDEIQPYLDAARAVGAVLVLDLQPGRADLLTQARLFEDFLREPDVGLAIDPEWKLGPEQLPGDQVGSVTVEEVDRLSRWLADLRRAEELPEKLFVVHAFRPEMVQGLPRLAARDGLATVLHVDGFGTSAVKTEVYGELSVKEGPVVNGFKLLYGEDAGLMTPAQVMALAPRPEYVTYQ